MKPPRCLLPFLIPSTAFLLTVLPATAQVPPLLNYQGRVAVGTVNFDGSGQFKFALVSGDGATSYWSNDGTSTSGSEPTAAVTLTVSKGLYSLLLGDASLAHMSAIPASVFTHPDVRLRIWFNDGTNGFQLLSPDQRVAATGYAMMAADVTDGAITAAKLAPASVGSAALAPNLALGGTTTGTFAGSGTTAYQTVAGTTQNAVGGGNYLLTNDDITTVTLPATPSIGDVVRINGVGAGGWQAAPSSGQSIAGASVNLIWTPRVVSFGSGENGWSAVASSSDGSKLIAGATGNFGGQLYTSTDSGVSWTPRESQRYWNGVASSADGTKLVAVDYYGTGIGGRIYTSTDSGVTWTPRESARRWNAVCSSSDGTKLVAVVQSGQIYTSTDSGVTWTPRESARNWRSVASSSNGSKLVAAANGGQLYTSTDSGVTWTARDSVRAWTGVASSSSGAQLVATDTGGFIYTSSNSGTTWSPRDSIRNWTKVASSADGTKLLACTIYTQLYVSTDSGATWAARENGRNWAGVASSSDGAKLVAVDLEGLIQTSTSPYTLAGAAGTTAALQYLGNNQWRALTEANAASANSVAAANITGTIGSAQIANAAVSNAQLANPSITINTGSGLTGGGTVALGGSVTLSASGSGVTSLIGGGGITVSGATGAVTLGSNATASNVAGSLIARDTNGSFSAGTITLDRGFALPSTTDSGVGVIQQNGNSLMHSFGSENFFAGANAGNFTTAATGTTGVGSGALFLSGSGVENTAFGALALRNTTSGGNNTAIGHRALVANATGASNTGVGSRALIFTTGGFNTAVGADVMSGNTSGSSNTAIGRNALYSNGAAVGNTAVGTGSLYYVTGGNNIGLGKDAGSQLTTGIDNIAIGHIGAAAETKTIRLGTQGTQTRTFIAGVHGTRTGDGTLAVLVDINGQLGTVTSSRRYKEDIADMGDASSKLQSLRPVTFRYKKPYENGEKPIQYGLIAEEVAEVFPELAVFNAEGQPETVKYQDLAPLLLNELQKLKAEKQLEVTSLRDENAAMKQRLAEMEEREQARAERMAKLEQLILDASKPAAAAAVNTNAD